MSHVLQRLTQHSQALWTSFLGGMPHLRRVYLGFGQHYHVVDEWPKNRVPQVLALLKAAEAAQRKLQVQVDTGICVWYVSSSQKG